MDTYFHAISRGHNSCPPVLKKMEALKAVNLDLLHHMSGVSAQESNWKSCSGPSLFGKVQTTNSRDFQADLPEPSRFSNVNAQRKLQQLVNQLRSTAELLKKEKEEIQDCASTLSLELMEVQKDNEELITENKRLKEEINCLGRLRKDIAAVQKHKEDAQGETLVLCMQLDMAELELEHMKLANSRLLKEIQEIREAQISGEPETGTTGFGMDPSRQNIDLSLRCRDGALEGEEEMEKGIMNRNIAVSKGVKLQEFQRGHIVDSDKRSGNTQEQGGMTQNISCAPPRHYGVAQARTVHGHDFVFSETGSLQSLQLSQMLSGDNAGLRSEDAFMQHWVKKQQSKICILTAEKNCIGKENAWLRGAMDRLETENENLILECDTIRTELSMMKDDLDVLLDKKCDDDIYAQNLENQLACMREELQQIREARAQAI